MSITFLHQFQERCRERRDHPALVHQGRRHTFAELDTLTRCAAAWLQSRGVHKGDRVVVCTANKLAFLITHLATLYAGAISLPLNPRFTREELRFFLQDSGARLAVAGDEVVRVVEGLQPDLPELIDVVHDTVVLQATAAPFPDVPVEPDDPCLIIYSSGTTGWPKGIVHTQANLLSSLLALGRCWRFTPDDVVLNVLPLYHVHGLCFATQLTLLSGACVVLEEFEPNQTMRSIAGCTVFMAVPTIYYRLLEDPTFREAARAWTNVRLFTCGSAPIRAEVLPILEEILGRPVINRYGMSEAFVITSLPLDGPWPYGSVGLPLEGIDVRVAVEEPPGELRLAQPGEVGAVQLRGPNLFREYWRQPETTQTAFKTGWFDTGDLGQCDHQGFLTLVGRKNDLIITSGFNVYPQVVERVINSCPGVRESAVLGIPDERKGERVVAAVVREDAALSEERLRAHWEERLVDYQRPKQVLFLDALPRNALGKVLRRELRERIQKM